MKDKLLLFTTDFEPLSSGVARYYFNLISALGHQGELVQVDKKFWWRLYPKWLPFFWRFKKLVKNSEVFYLGAGQILPLGLPLFYLTKKYHKKFIIFTHGLDVANLSGRKKWLAKFLLSHADLIITNSKFTKNLIDSKFHPSADGLNSKFLVLTPCASVLPAPEPDFRLTPPDEPFIFSYGRLVARKGFVDLALALKKLWLQGENFYWFLAGAGPELENIKKAVGEFQDKFIYLGEVTDQYLSNYLNQCVFFAMTPRNNPTDPEGFGMVYLEAGSLGKAVLGTKTGGVPEAIKDGSTGLLAESGDINDIAEKALELLKNTALTKELGQNGLNMIKNEFLWSKRAEILDTLLTKLS